MLFLFLKVFLFGVLLFIGVEVIFNVVINFKNLVFKNVVKILVIMGIILVVLLVGIVVFLYIYGIMF